MNTEFVIDEKNNLLLMTITADFRHRMANAHVRIGISAATKIVEEQFECPKGFLLGKCLNPTASVDNEYQNRCSETWIFSLILKEKPTPPPPKKVVTRSKKTTTRRK